MRKIAVCILSLIFLFGNVQSFAHDEHGDIHNALFKTVTVKNGTRLDIVECVALAFKNSPKIKRKKYELDVAKSNVGIAKSAFFPVIGAGVGFHNENNSDNRVYQSHYRELPNVAATINQLVWDFGKSTANIKMEEFYKIGAEYEFIDSVCLTLFDVKQKYYDVLRNQALVDVAEDNVKMCEKYLKNAQDRPAKTTAEVYLSMAKYNLNVAQNNLNNAKVKLSNAMFIDNTPDYYITPTKTFAYNKDYGYEGRLIPPEFVPQKFDFSKAKAMDIAYTNSPDIKVLEATKNAMVQSLNYVKRTYFPELSANVGYGYNNTNETSNNSLQVGVNLSTSVNLMQLKHSIKGADAQLKIADNEITLFKKDLYFEVQEAFNNVDVAEKNISQAQKMSIQSLDNLEVVEGLYMTKKLDYTSLHDAREDYILARQNYINSLYNYNMSLIEVEEALHYHIIDIHHRTQHAITEHSAELAEHLNDALNCDEKEKKRNNKKKSKNSKDNL